MPTIKIISTAYYILPLDIAGTENGVDYDVLIAACLLHDIARQEQYDDPQLSHAVAGGEKAYKFLLEHDFTEVFAGRVRDCIQTHSYRIQRLPESLEAKIVFDADKLDASGTLGIARTLLYQGRESEPLYTLLPDGRVSDGTDNETPSFFREYKYKLEHIYSRFFTARAAELAGERKASADAFYSSMLSEVRGVYRYGTARLDEICKE